ncbi:MAG: non-canonical purine NTP pyrophosphatase [Treponema sp.]|nr:non-canonical purine NTP pyrophosphatase [Treponema sp.]
MKIYLASSNKNKKREISEIFPMHEIVTPADEGIEFDPEETGNTFLENSLIKARALHLLTGHPVLADDSGICVDALGGVPGVWSSRYAGPEFHRGRPDGSKIPQSEQNAFLIGELNAALASGNVDIEAGKKQGLFKDGPRSAHYACAMVLLTGVQEYAAAVQVMEGTLLEDVSQARGNGGFGYDPIFFLPKYGKTAAELTAEEKNAISHRGKAARMIMRLLNGSAN